MRGVMPVFLQRFFSLLLIFGSSSLCIAFPQDTPHGDSTKSASGDQKQLDEILYQLDVQRVEAADYVSQAKKLDSDKQQHARSLYTRAAAQYNAYLDYVSSAIRQGKHPDLKKHSDEARDAADKFTAYVEEVTTTHYMSEKSVDAGPGHLVADTLIGSITKIIDWLHARNVEKRNLFADEVLKHKWPPWEKEIVTIPQNGQPNT
jgi:hypothetical protein